MSTLENSLDELTAEGKLYERLEDGAVRCHACAHRCYLRPGRRGVCQVRFNRGGTLRVPAGYVASLQVDPVEKKPFYHLLAGTNALTFGMLGCNFHCGYCQNWLTSQALRDPEADYVGRQVRRISPEEIVEHGRRQKARVVASSYNEPLITAEWSYEIFKLAREQGMLPVYISNGYASPEVLEYLQPVLAGFKVDLKTMQESRYRSLGGQLGPVLESIQLAHDLGMWVEVVTLIIPDYNDSEQEFKEIAEYLVSVSPDIPWHVTAFHPDYKMRDTHWTSREVLVRAAEIGHAKGLRYVYAGNRPGDVGRYEHTYCHDCGALLIERYSYIIRKYRLQADGSCPQCGTRIPGVWTDQPQQVTLHRSGFPRVI